MDNISLSEVLQLISAFGNWVMFAWLFITKDKALDSAREAHRDDLREVAGMRDYIQRRAFSNGRAARDDDTQELPRVNGG